MSGTLRMPMSSLSAPAMPPLRLLGARCGRARHHARSCDHRRPRRQQPLHGRAHAPRLQQRRGRQDADRSVRSRARQHGFRHIHGRAILRRHGPHDALPHGPGSVRHPRAQQPRDVAVAEEAGREIPAAAGPPGLQGRRRFKFWGGLCGRDLGRRRRPRRQRAQGVRREGHQDLLRNAGVSLLTDDDGRVLGVKGEAPGPHAQTSRPARSCSPAAASSRAPRCARAISAPAGISRRCAARATTWARGITDGARHRRACPTATGRAATPWAGTATRRPSATSTSATSSRSTAIRWGIMINARRRALRRRRRGLPQLHLRASTAASS